MRRKKIAGTDHIATAMVMRFQSKYDQGRFNRNARKYAKVAKVQGEVDPKFLKEFQEKCAGIDDLRNGNLLLKESVSSFLKTVPVSSCALLKDLTPDDLLDPKPQNTKRTAFQEEMRRRNYLKRGSGGQSEVTDELAAKQFQKNSELGEEVLQHKDLKAILRHVTKLSRETIEEFNRRFTDEEVQEAVRHIKCKSADPVQIRHEYLKYVPLEDLTRWVNREFFDPEFQFSERDGDGQNDCLLVKMVSLYKGSSAGDIKDPLAYRYIAIGGALLKLCMCLYSMRLWKLMQKEISGEEDQFGYKPKEGTREMLLLINMVRETAERYCLSGVFHSVFLSALDLRKAFPSFFWDLVCELAAELGIGESSLFISFKQSQRNASYAFGSVWIRVLNGMKEGCSSSPRGFSLGYNSIVNFYRELRRANGGGLELLTRNEAPVPPPDGKVSSESIENETMTQILFGKQDTVVKLMLYCFRFADDTTLLDQEPRRNAVKLEKALKEFEQVKKLKPLPPGTVIPSTASVDDYLVATKKGCLREHPGKREIGNILKLIAKIVGNLTHLESDVARRERSIWSAFYTTNAGMSGIKGITELLRGEFITTYVQSIAVYGADARSWTVKELNRLQKGMNAILVKFTNKQRWKREHFGINLHDLQFEYCMHPFANTVFYMQAVNYAHTLRREDAHLTRAALTGRILLKVDDEALEKLGLNGLKGLRYYSSKTRRKVTFMSNVMKFLVVQCGIPPYAMRALTANKRVCKELVKEKRAFTGKGDASAEVSDKDAEIMSQKMKRWYYAITMERFLLNSLKMWEKGLKVTAEDLKKRREDLFKKKNIKAKQPGDEAQTEAEVCFKENYCFVCEENHSCATLRKHFEECHEYCPSEVTIEKQTIQDAVDASKAAIEYGQNIILEENADMLRETDEGVVCTECDIEYGSHIENIGHHCQDHRDGRYVKAWKSNLKDGKFHVDCQKQNCSMFCVIKPKDTVTILKKGVKYTHCRYCDEFTVVIDGETGPAQSARAQKMQDHEDKCKKTSSKTVENHLKKVDKKPPKKKKNANPNSLFDLENEKEREKAEQEKQAKKAAEEALEKQRKDRKLAEIAEMKKGRYGFTGFKGISQGAKPKREYKTETVTISNLAELSFLRSRLDGDIKDHCLDTGSRHCKEKFPKGAEFLKIKHVDVQGEEFADSDLRMMLKELAVNDTVDVRVAVEVQEKVADDGFRGAFDSFSEVDQQYVDFKEKHTQALDEFAKNYDQQCFPKEKGGKALTKTKAQKKAGRKKTDDKISNKRARSTQSAGKVRSVLGSKGQLSSSSSLVLGQSSSSSSSSSSALGQPSSSSSSSASTGGMRQTSQPAGKRRRRVFQDAMNVDFETISQARSRSKTIRGKSNLEGALEFSQGTSSMRSSSGSNENIKVEFRKKKSRKKKTDKSKEEHESIFRKRSRSPKRKGGGEEKQSLSFEKL